MGSLNRAIDLNCELQFYNDKIINSKIMFTFFIFLLATSSTAEFGYRGRCPAGFVNLIGRCIRTEEFDELMNVDTKTDQIDVTTPSDKIEPVTCLLPQFPLNGKYTFPGNRNIAPGQELGAAYLTYSCDPGYKLVGPSFIYCVDGEWSEIRKPQCVLTCKLHKHPSVDYHCFINESFVNCDDHVLSGDTVIPSCKSPLYYFPSVLPLMQCIDGVWNYEAMCLADCGKVISKGEQMVAGGRLAERGELPWHAGIYTKKPYDQICGGSIISNTVVISAAHCFWSNRGKQLPASDFAVAVGKLYRDWDSPLDIHAQFSDVKDIKLPARFQGNAANFQEDIALVMVTNPFVYEMYVRPVCVDFDINFERLQLHGGNIGKVAGWGFTDEDGSRTGVLEVANLPYVDILQCLSQVPVYYRGFITSDKICAGWTNGTAVCRGDSGGGLAFLGTERGSNRYFLRGVVSTAPQGDRLCNVHTVASFTWVARHEIFIRRHFVL